MFKEFYSLEKLKTDTRKLTINAHCSAQGQAEDTIASLQSMLLLQDFSTVELQEVIIYIYNAALPKAKDAPTLGTLITWTL